MGGPTPLPYRYAWIRVRCGARDQLLPEPWEWDEFVQQHLLSYVDMTAAFVADDLPGLLAEAEQQKQQ